MAADFAASQGGPPLSLLNFRHLPPHCLLLSSRPCQLLGPPYHTSLLVMPPCSEVLVNLQCPVPISGATRAEYVGSLGFPIRWNSPIAVDLPPATAASMLPLHE